MYTMYSITKSLNEANVQSFISGGTCADTLMQFFISPTSVHLELMNISADTMLLVQKFSRI